MSKHLRFRGPVLVPHQFQGEIQCLSKAALMDMVWDLVSQRVESSDDHEAVMAKFREDREPILIHRDPRRKKESK